MGTKIFAVAFGLFGFAASLIVGLAGDAPFDEALGTAALWGGTFLVLGFFIGHTTMILLGREGIPDLPEEGDGSTPPDGGDGFALPEDRDQWERDRGANGESGSRPEKPSTDAPRRPITDDEAQAARRVVTPGATTRGPGAE